MKKTWLLALSAIVFIIFFVPGLYFAQYKSLWGDEIFSYVANISQPSYRQILLGKINEGNVSPLFYLIQKAICDVAHYQPPASWLGNPGTWTLPSDPFTRIFLRINPLFFMSMSAVLIFYYFSRFHSWGMGLWSMLLMSSSYMTWVYGFESRHYALWVFLTTCQALLFLYITRHPSNESSYPGLVLIHILLAFTVILSVAQIVIVSFLLWIYCRWPLKRFVLLAILPLCIFLFYYLRTPHGYPFYFAHSFKEILAPSFTSPQMILLILYGVFLSLLYSPVKTKLSINEDEPFKKTGGVFWLFTVLMLLAAIVILGAFKMGAVKEQVGFMVSVRYFIFLVPVGIIASLVFFSDLLALFKHHQWMQTNICIVVGGLLILNALNCQPLWIHLLFLKHQFFG
ncbi:MAG: hypothetical protein Q7S13_05290 [Candidatus Omnitrophota bacterium]|nr:hypothetical protein [Candidatus Omnitrophota bacterium]